MATRAVAKARIGTLVLAAASVAACGLSVVGSAGPPGSSDDTVGAEAGTGTGTGTGTGKRDSGADSNVSPLTDAATTDVSVPDATPEAGVDAGPPVVVRLNFNGPTHVGVDYPGTWEASPVPGVCGPSAYAAAHPLSNTNDAPLFTGEAYGDPLRCSVGNALVKGRYHVVLYFAEVYFGPGCPGGGGVGSRKFDVLLEGKKVLSDFDVFAESGGCMATTGMQVGTPVVRGFDVDIDDGTLNIRMPASANNAKLSALELFGPL